MRTQCVVLLILAHRDGLRWSTRVKTVVPGYCLGASMLFFDGTTGLGSGTALRHEHQQRQHSNWLRKRWWRMVLQIGAIVAIPFGNRRIG